MGPCPVQSSADALGLSHGHCWTPYYSHLGLEWSGATVSPDNAAGVTSDGFWLRGKLGHARDVDTFHLQASITVDWLHFNLDSAADESELHDFGTSVVSRETMVSFNTNERLLFSQKIRGTRPSPSSESSLGMPKATSFTPATPKRTRSSLPSHDFVNLGGFPLAVARRQKLLISPLPSYQAGVFSTGMHARRHVWEGWLWGMERRMGLLPTFLASPDECRTNFLALLL
jgi:hypothetical protein